MPADGFQALETNPRRFRAAVCVLAGLIVGLAACTDAELYSPTRAKAQADRVTLEGRVCTEDPFQSRFPVRVLLMVDRAAGPLFSDFDPSGSRTRALQRFVKDTLNLPKTAVTVVGYAGRPAKLAPADGNFSTNPGELAGAVNQLAISQPCIGEDRCRDYREALRSAQGLIEGDVNRLPSGARVLTQYYVLMLNAGPQRPRIDPRECCAPDDSECISEIENADEQKYAELARACEERRASELVTEMEETVSRAGAGGFQFHAVHLAAHGGNVQNGDAIDDRVGDTMESMAFAGNGTYQRFNAAGGLDDTAFDVLGFRTELRAKLLLASNNNALPGPEGPDVDSDADGLSDVEEREAETSPVDSDTDGDAISDRVELLTGFDPTREDEPAACSELEEPTSDADLDRLTACDEALLGTEPTLVDTDGDGLPDPLGVFSGTDYLNPDADLDTDGDGVDNGEELRQHTDPRSNDTETHLSSGYRYEVDDQGVVTDLFAAAPERIGGVEIVGLSDGTTPGIGTLEYLAESRRLQWRDARDGAFGTPVDVGEGGQFELPSGSFAPVQGEDGKRIEVEVRPEALPPRSITETIRVTSRRRQCLEYSIRNIRLMETMGGGGRAAGNNAIVLYFSQAPAGNFQQPGPFRRAVVPVRFRPPDRREPPGAILRVENREFVRPEIAIPEEN